MRKTITFTMFGLIILPFVYGFMSHPTQENTAKPYMLVVPILPDKMEAFRMFIDEMKGDRAEEWTVARKALGFVREKLWIQQTPQGNFLVVYQENIKPDKYIGELLQSEREIDKYFVRKLKELHGVDLRAEQPAPNKLLWQYQAGSYPNPAAAFFVPVQEGKAAQHKALFEAMNGEKQDAAIASQRRWGLSREMFWEQKTPMGTLIIVLQESSDFEMMGGEILSSNDDFDLWFFQQIYEIYGVDVHGYEPIPQNSQVIDWSAN
ncbi:MAG: hypothetical protein ACE5I1_20520 [bacterium]